MMDCIKEARRTIQEQQVSSYGVLVHSFDEAAAITVAGLRAALNMVRLELAQAKVGRCRAEYNYAQVKLESAVHELEHAKAIHEGKEPTC
jgi:hypothetical protein